MTSQAPVSLTAKFSTVRFRHCNVRSVKPKSSQVKQFCSEADIIALTETWDDGDMADNKFADLRSFNVHRRSRADGYGGVALVVRSKGMPSYRRHDLEHPTLELLVVELPSVALTVAVYYAPPDSVSIVVPLLCEHLGNFSQEVVSRLIVTGDFNCPGVDFEMRRAKTVHGQALLGLMREMNYKQIVEFPTRNENLLDLLFVPNSIPVLGRVAIPPPSASCDHIGQQADLYVKVAKFHGTVKSMWRFNDANHSLFITSLINRKLDLTVQLTSLKNLASLIDSELTNTALRFHKWVTVRKSSPCHRPSPAVRRMRMLRDTAFAKYRKSGHGTKAHFREIWKKRSKAFEVALEQYETKKLLLIASASRQNSKKFWHYVQSSVDRKPIPPIKDVNGQLCFGDVDRAEILNRGFSAVMLPCLNHCKETEADLCLAESDGSWPPFTEEEVQMAFLSLNPNKSDGPFQVTAGLLLRTGTALYITLAKLFSLCCAAGYFPDDWKTAFVVPIPKASKDPTDVSSWRPISMLHPLSKVFEKCIANRLRSFLELGGAFGDNQFGFREHRSTELAGLLVTQNWKDILNHGKKVDAIFLDCTKAFDRVDHNCLIRKLEFLQVPSQCVSVLRSYLINRKQVVIVNGKYSEPLPVTSGVPQGSVLGPLMFIALMCDIHTVVSPGTCLTLFADDILVYRPQFIAEDNEILQLDLDQINAWGAASQLSFNSAKSAYLRLSRSGDPGDDVYRLAGAIIPNVPTVKYLGLHIDRKLNWSEHWSEKCATGRKRFRYINSLFQYRNSAARLQLFSSLVQSVLDYCPSVTWSFSIMTVKQVENCAGKFLRTIRLGFCNKWSTDERYMKNALEIGWTSQLVRRVKLTLLFAYKLIMGIIPLGSLFFQPYLFPSHSGPSASTRRQDRLINHPCPIQPAGTFVNGKMLPTCQKSFVHVVCTIWNSFNFSADVFQFKWKFSSALDTVDWKVFPVLTDILPRECLF